MTFESEMLRAQAMQPERPEYWAGYIRGLRRAHHGEAFGTPEEHCLWLSLVADDDEARRERGYGYIDGFAEISETASPDELRAYLKRHGLTQVKAAGVCKVSDRTMRRWALGAVPMPRGAWELLKIKVAQTEKAGSQQAGSQQASGANSIKSNGSQ